MSCRVCHEPGEMVSLWTAVDGSVWRRCLACGSDSSDVSYGDIKHEYDEKYLRHILDQSVDLAGCAFQVTTNANWFGAPSGDKTFLDVGCLEGGALKAMADRGWSVHGFDVIPQAKTGDHITVSDRFHASLFPRRYQAVLCREVIEHVPDWRSMLGELLAVTAPGGIFQLQTPRPWTEPSTIGYQRFHLQLFSPFTIRYWLGTVGFEIIESLLWPEGQAWLCRRP